MQEITRMCSIWIIYVKSVKYTYNLYKTHSLCSAQCESIENCESLDLLSCLFLFRLLLLLTLASSHDGAIVLALESEFFLWRSKLTGSSQVSVSKKFEIDWEHQPGSKPFSLLTVSSVSSREKSQLWLHVDINVFVKKCYEFSSHYRMLLNYYSLRWGRVEKAKAQRKCLKRKTISTSPKRRFKCKGHWPASAASSLWRAAACRCSRLRCRRNTARLCRWLHDKRKRTIKWKNRLWVGIWKNS